MLGLEREVCFAIASKDSMKPIGPSPWILYTDTVDVFPFLKDPVNSFFTSL